MVSADEITEPKKMYRNAKHNGNRSTASGNVEIKINRPHPEQVPDKDYRPDKGEVLFGEEDQSVDIEAKRIELHGRYGSKSVASASRDVRIFGKLRRKRR